MERERRWVTFKVFSLDRFLQRLAKQIFDDYMVGKAGCNTASWIRTARRGSGGAVLRRDAAPGRARAVLTWKLGHCFFEPSSCSCDSLEACGRICHVST